MTSEITVSDESALQAAIADVRNDNTPINYVIGGHAGGQFTIIELRTTGSDTTEIPSHMNDDEVLFCLARYEFGVGLSRTVKFVYIHWIGERVSGRRKGHFGAVQGSIEKYFSPSHLSISTSSKEDLETERILDLLKTKYSSQ